MSGEISVKFHFYAFSGKRHYEITAKRYPALQNVWNSRAIAVTWFVT